MSKFEVKSEVEAANDIRLASGNIIHKGTQGRVIGSSYDGAAVSVTFEGYIGAVSIWASELAPANAAPAPATPAADDSGYTELIDELDGRIKALERENEMLRDCISEILGEVEIAKEVPDKVYTLLRKIAQLATAPADDAKGGE